MKRLIRASLPLAACVAILTTPLTTGGAVHAASVMDMSPAMSAPTSIFGGIAGIAVGTSDTISGARRIVREAELEARMVDLWSRFGVYRLITSDEE